VSGTIPRSLTSPHQCARFYTTQPLEVEALTLRQVNLRIRGIDEEGGGGGGIGITVLNVFVKILY
jgi:hypothetical protein